MLTLKTPKNYLSYSQIDLVMKNPKGYVDQYLYGRKSAPSIHQEFGSAVTDILEGKTTKPAKLRNKLTKMGIPRYSLGGVEISCTLTRKKGKIKLLGFLDGLSDNLQGEYKTGMIPWTNAKVSASLQLKIYALIHYKNHGKIPKQQLVWIKTCWDGAKISLAGDYEVFNVTHNLKELLETEALVWRAYDKIISLIGIEYEKI